MNCEQHSRIPGLDHAFDMHNLSTEKAQRNAAVEIKFACKIKISSNSRSEVIHRQKALRLAR